MYIPHPANHPTGIAGAVATLLLLLAPKVGIHLDKDASLSIAGAIVVIASLLSPRLVEVAYQIVLDAEGETTPDEAPEA